MTSKLAPIALVLCLAACSSNIPLVESVNDVGQGTCQTYDVRADEAWTAAVSVMQGYPIKSVNRANGYIQTEAMMADNRINTENHLSPLPMRKNSEDLSLSTLSASLKQEPGQVRICVLDTVAKTTTAPNDAIYGYHPSLIINGSLEGNVHKLISSKLRK